MNLSTLFQSGWITVVMVILHFVSVAWHTVHPLASILSGHFNKPLTPFVDENSIETTFTRAVSFETSRSPARQIPLVTRKTSSFCQSLQAYAGAVSKDTQNIPCFTFSQGNNPAHLGSQATTSSTIDVAQIVPIQAPVAPKNEAIVVVLPFNWASSSGLNTENMLLEFVHHLAKRPWLATTIFVVAPVTDAKSSNTTTTTTAAAVAHFLDQFLGYPSASSSSTLPLEYSGALIRQLIVLDLIVEPILSPNIMISPQGYRGIMPNMDLYSVAHKVFSHNLSPRMIRSYPASIEQRSKPWKDWIRRLIANQQSSWPKEPLLTWWDAMVEWIIWEVSVATSIDTSDIPNAHAAALDRGIDALTMQAVNLVSANGSTNSLRTYLKSVEMILHAFSNAHERLHHNTALFALPRNHGNAYVKHEEFLIPNLLLLVPLIARAVALVLSFRASRLKFDFGAVGAAIQFVVGGTLMIAIAIDATERISDASHQSSTAERSARIPNCRAVVAVCYMVLVASWFRLYHSHDRSSVQKRADRCSSLQLVACLLALYLQVGIAFGNLSLAYPSALFWTPPIAFVSFAPQPPPTATTWLRIHSVAWWLLSAAFLLVASPFSFVVPSVFLQFTTYIKYVYIPLHLSTMTFLLS